MYTATINIANDKTLTLLKDLEALELIEFLTGKEPQAIPDEYEVPIEVQQEMNRRTEMVEAGKMKVYSVEQVKADLAEHRKQISQQR